MQRGHFLCPSRRRNPVCRYTAVKFLVFHFYPFSLVAPKFRFFFTKNVLDFENLISPSFWNLVIFGVFWAGKNLWRHVGANLRIFTHIKYQRHQVIRRVTKRPLNQQHSLQTLNGIRIAWISRNWHNLEVFWKLTFWLIFEFVSNRKFLKVSKKCFLFNKNVLTCPKSKFSIENSSLVKFFYLSMLFINQNLSFFHENHLKIDENRNHIAWNWP